MKREVKPELLDGLPPNDPGAIGSRRDLQKLHRWMGHRGLMEGALRSAVKNEIPRRFVELGGGDGVFMLRVSRRVAPRWPGLSLALVDQQQLVTPQTRTAFADLGWRLECFHADVFEWIQQFCSSRRKEALTSGRNAHHRKTDPPYQPPSDYGSASVGCHSDCDGPDSHCEVMIANLFLHHFDDARLIELFRGIAQVTKTFIALEPRRSRLALTFSQQIWAIGCNRVSRHDAPVSVRAGFAGKELSLLWPRMGNWSLEERPAGMFSHLFMARRRS